MKLKGIGEFPLIERLTEQLRDYGDSVVLGIGDDTAVFRSPHGKYLLATCDMLVEGHHFKREWISGEQLGHKALAVSLSDIAAMGGVPRYVLVAAGWPSQTDLEYAAGIYRGMGALAASHEVFVIGGDTVSAPQLILDVTVIGEMEKEPVTRAGAVVGDVFAVTGNLGASAAGLALLEAVLPPSLSTATGQALLEAHLMPLPRVKEASVLLEMGSLSAMIDISDGLASEVEHICKQSVVGAKIELSRLPVGEKTRKAADALGRNYLDWALHGGEDYELLVTLPGEKVPAVKTELARLGVDFTKIGKVTGAGQGVCFLDANGQTVKKVKKGYDHFSDYKHKD